MTSMLVFRAEKRSAQASEHRSSIGKPLTLIMQFQLISKSYSLDNEFESTAFSVVLDDNPEVCLPWFYPKYVPRYSHNNFSLQ